MFSRKFVRDFGFWLEKTLPRYIEYLDTHGPMTQTTFSSDWKSGAKVRASSLDKCPKYHAAERLELAKKHFEDKMLYRFALANRAADLFKEAMCWAVVEENSLAGNSDITWTAAIEHRIEHDHIAGTMDGMLTAYKEGWSSAVNLPVEIKYTGADAHDGLSPDQVWQLITYVVLARATAGYLVTLYDWKSSSGTHKIWPVVLSEDGQGWYVQDLNGEPAVFEGIEWPTRNGHNFFSRQDFETKVMTHRGYYEMLRDDPETTMKPYDQPNWRCGYINRPDYYHRKYTNPNSGETFAVGDKKPGSGYIIPGCPLFSLCWGESGDRVPISVIEDKIHIESGVVA